MLICALYAQLFNMEFTAHFDQLKNNSDKPAPKTHSHKYYVNKKIKK